MFALRANDQPAKKMSAETTRSQADGSGLGRSATDHSPTA